MIDIATTIKSSDKFIILCNESFGGVYFNQSNGRMVMIDPKGFEILLKYLKNTFLTEQENTFVSYFFPPNAPQNVELRMKPILNKSNKSGDLISTAPVLIDLSLNNYCNLHCEYCYMSAIPEKFGKHISMEDFDYLVQEMKRNRVLQIALGGGEPTLHPYFTEILYKLRTKGNIMPNYTTNGTNLTPEILNASKAYCGAVAVSYSEAREKETLEATQKLHDYGILTNLHIVLLKSRISHLAEIVEKYARLGISSVVLLLFKPMGRGANIPYEIMSIEDKNPYAQEIFKILALYQKYGIRLALDACSAFTAKEFPFIPESVDGCTGATYTAYIDWKLHMKPCSFMQSEEGIDLHQNSILDAWNSPLFNRFRKLLLNPRYEGCMVCDFLSSCWGGCPLKPELTYCEAKGKPLPGGQ